MAQFSAHVRIPGVYPASPLREGLEKGDVINCARNFPGRPSRRRWRDRKISTPPVELRFMRLVKPAERNTGLVKAPRLITSCTPNSAGRTAWKIASCFAGRATIALMRAATTASAPSSARRAIFHTSTAALANRRSNSPVVPAKAGTQYSRTLVAQSPTIAITGCPVGAGHDKHVLRWACPHLCVILRRGVS